MSMTLREIFSIRFQRNLVAGFVCMDCLRMFRVEPDFHFPDVIGPIQDFIPFSR
jgi:hypothetical protein